MSLVLTPLASRDKLHKKNQKARRVTAPGSEKTNGERL